MIWCMKQQIVYLDKYQATIYLVNNGDVKYEQRCKIFDSRLEINISELLKPLDYIIEVHVKWMGLRIAFHQMSIISCKLVIRMS
ncbi:hypothetical protein IGI49_004125 [Enterococcus sp. AZ071]